ncbi:YciI family protein [Siculibacillus lacustris]|uniref:YciI family protein n=1 Tax=Siculibacillus lacustris TaxID=1549641 RepID=A0A4Q9VMP6_9HYPH|nr:YciI family protein [Siculibacillus lacustris]TBW36315.1 YciI family protein [Siculibacillus lacustris]
MLFVAVCRDKPDHLAVRTAHRDAHRAWLAGLGHTLKIAGPFLDDAGHEMIGSMLILEADSLEAARATFAADPYAIAGLFAAVEVRPWLWIFGKPA